ncbi:S26 family signal peptidase [Microbispora sp. ATCC PTA-5024]|uniref:S26 family signal peptidase n=1 Tax=Microbispora sp. ATCC PTA-5024 TaxID=316330 RepID=UPI0003DBD218|nr:S26 family signal peptidase [Microbispora sp. ATCC PTA-5024]ETK38161.1 hypothetical protein MPTA5024_00215 [Microbispora sp. ATCC PTA-5024]
MTALPAVLATTAPPVVPPVVPTAALTLVLAVVLAVVAAAALARRHLLVVTVRGSSMAPAYRDGDRLLAARLPPVRGHAVVFLPPPGWAIAPPQVRPYLVKRVVAVGGDPVPEAARAAVGAGRVPPGRLVVFGDAASSADSRTWGLVPVSSVAGVVVGVLARRAGTAGRRP